MLIGRLGSMNSHFLQNLQNGQSLLEIVFAIAIFTIGVVTVGYLIIDARVSMQNAADLTEARLLATEGIEAVRSIREGGFNLIPTGTHSLVMNEGRWSFASSTDSYGKFTRVIMVEEIDADNKNVTSSVTWSLPSGREKSVDYKTRLTNWLQNNGDSGEIAVFTESASLYSSSTELRGLSLENQGTKNVTITDMEISWDGSANLDSIVFEGDTVFLASTSTLVESGQAIDIIDYQLEPFTGFHPIDVISFSESVEGSNFVVRFTLSDDSTRSVYVSP